MMNRIIPHFNQLVTMFKLGTSSSKNVKKSETF